MPPVPLDHHEVEQRRIAGQPGALGKRDGPLVEGERGPRRIAWGEPSQEPFAALVATRQNGGAASHCR
jgi:hypothetical protein